jgi:two-component system NarL family sensor kinase
MGAPAGLIESPQKATVAPEARAAESAAPRADAGGRTDSDLKRLADSLLKKLESDRAHMAAVLADEIVSVMTMARYLIEDAAQRLAHGELDQTSEALQSASARIRDASCRLLGLCSELRPRLLDDLGLLAALSWYLRDFSQENRAIFVSPRITVTEANLPAELKLAIFRIVQYALSNVARHSKASAARVFLSMSEDELRLGIEDNGVGFDVERWRRRPGHDGCGLGMMQRLADSSGGRCSIEAVPRHGARVYAVWRMRAAAQTPSAESAATSDIPPVSSPV